MVLDAGQLTGVITALGILITAFGGVQLRRDGQARKERAQTRKELGTQRRLLALAIRHITRQDYVLAGYDLQGPPLHPELEELIRGEDPDDRDAAPPPSRRAPDEGTGRRSRHATP